MAYDEERLKNGLAYIAMIHKQISQYDAYQTRMYKYLALIDFEQIKRVGRSVFNLNYVALEKGPVPIELYDNEDKYAKEQPFENLLKIEKTDSKMRFITQGEPDLQYFSDSEISLIESVVEKYATPSLSTKALCAATHKEIAAWKVAWDARRGSDRVPINPLDTFPGILEKDFDSLTPVEETALHVFHAHN